MKAKKRLKAFEKFSENTFVNIPIVSSTLLEAIKYSFFSGGKRIRAQFVYAVGEAINLDIEDCNKIAFAIETIHTYSLIHDDLPAMDNDTLRRGKPTCHIKFNDATAILAGDALQALAFDVIQDLNINNINKLKRINKVLASCCGISGMVAGQQLDIEGENKQLNLKELEIVHINKTAKMFIASILLPYIASDNYNIVIEETLIKLATLIGLCFQIKDDILDVTKTSQELGKTSNKDINSNKSTYVSLMGLEDSQIYLNKKRTEIYTILNDLKNLNINLSEITNLIDLVIDRNY